MNNIRFLTLWKQSVCVWNWHCEMKTFLSHDLRLQNGSWKKKKSRFFTVNVQKQLFLFKKLRQYTPLSIIFSIFSQQFLFPFFLNIASDIWLYWLLYQCLSIRNAKWSLPKWNFQWMAREKKWRATFHADDACSVNLKQQFFTCVCTFLLKKTRRWRNKITGFLPTFHNVWK